MAKKKQSGGRKLAYAEAVERRDALDNPAIPLNELLTQTGLFDEAVSEIVVTPEKAMTVMAFFSCVSLLSRTIGMLDLLVYDRIDGARQLVADDPRADLLQYDANPRDISLLLWSYEVLCLCVWGAGYVWMESDAGGDIVALWPIKPTRIMPIKAPDGTPYWAVENDDHTRDILAWDEVMPFRAIGMDMVHAMAPYKIARQALGISKAAEEFAARTFSNGSRPYGVITHDKQITAQQWDAIKASWGAGHKGLKNAHNIGMLPMGVDYKAVDYNPEPYQHIAAREFEVAEMGRLFSIPLHYLGVANANTTYASVDAQSLDFVNFTIAWYLKLFGQTIRKYMFRFPSDKASRRFVEHDTKPLLRTDAVSAAKIMAVRRMWSVTTRNEERERIGMAPSPGGDLFWAPVTAAPLDEKGQFLQTPPHKLVGSTEEPTDDGQGETPKQNQPVIADGEPAQSGTNPMRDLEDIDVSVKHEGAARRRLIEQAAAAE